VWRETPLAPQAAGLWGRRSSMSVFQPRAKGSARGFFVKTLGAGQGFMRDFGLEFRIQPQRRRLQMTIEMIPLKNLRPSSGNPRKRFDEAAIVGVNGGVKVVHWAEQNQAT